MRWRFWIRASGWPERRRNDPLAPPGAPLPHTISDAPFDPVADQANEGGKLANATQLQVMWWKFPPPPAGGLVGGFPAVHLSCRGIRGIRRALRPAPPRHRQYLCAAAGGAPVRQGQVRRTPLRLCPDDGAGHGNLRRVYTDDLSRPQKLRFFCKGEPYKFWGMIHDRAAPCLRAQGRQRFFLGTDRLGRDIIALLSMARASR